MKRILIFLIITISGVNLFSQNNFTLKNASDTASFSMIDSTLVIKIDGKEYIRLSKNNTPFLVGKAEVWDDMRIPVTSTFSSGSNPPVFSSFMNSGGTYAGSAMEFDGVDDFDSIPANTKLNFQNTDFTIAFWIQPDHRIMNDANIVYKKDSRNISIQNKKIRVYLEGRDVFLSTLELNMGARNFVVVSVKSSNSGSALYVYINNKPAGKASYNYPVIDNTAPLLIGKAEHKGYGNNYKGILDEYNVWKKCLTNEERDSLWNDSKGTQKIIAKASHLFGFGFDDPSSSVQSDNGGGTDIKAYTAGDKTKPAYTEGLISKTIISHGVFLYFFHPHITQELFFTAQLPHTWVEGSGIEAHVHYVRPDGGQGTVVWGLEYTWTNMLDNFGTTKTIYAYDSSATVYNKHCYTSFGFIDGTGKKISSMLVCRIFRDAENPKDTFADDVGLLEIDFHIKNNTLGSKGKVK
jgi:hypothetical protein